MEYKIYKFASNGDFIQEETMYSDREQDLATMTFAKGYTHIPPSGPNCRWNGTAWEDKPVDPVIVPPTIDEYKAIACQTIRDKSSELKQALQAEYSEIEIATFQQQFDGATDIAGGNSTTLNAQFVISLLTIRLGKTPEETEITEFANRIISNFNMAKAATLDIMGRQQNAELAVRTCSTNSEVDTVVATYMSYYYG